MDPASLRQALSDWPSDDALEIVRLAVLRSQSRLDQLDAKNRDLAVRLSAPGITARESLAAIVEARKVNRRLAAIILEQLEIARAAGIAIDPAPAAGTAGADAGLAAIQRDLEAIIAAGQG